MKTIILLFMLVSVSYSQGLLTILAPEEEASIVNIVTNGTFDTDSDWGKGTGWTIAGGVANSNSESGYNALTQNIGLTASTTYGYSLDITYTSGELQMRYHNGSYVLVGNWTSAGTKTGEFTTVGTPNGTLYVRTQGGFVGTVDNIVIWVIE